MPKKTEVITIMEITTTLSDLKKLAPIAQRVFNQHFGIEHCKEEIDRLEKTKYHSYFAFVLSVIGIIVGTAATIILAVKSDVMIDQVPFMYTAPWLTGMPMVAFPCVGLVIGIVLDIINLVKKNNKRKEQIAQLYEEISNRTKEADVFIRANRSSISKVPEKYFHPFAINYFIEVMSEGRADDFKEAMNMFDLYVHRLTLENAANASMIAQQQMAKDTAAIRRSSATSATANSVSAVANSITAATVVTDFLFR